MRTPIADQVREMRSRADGENAFIREQAELAATAPRQVVPLGTSIPDAELLDVHGVATTLHTAIAGRAAVVVFYRGAWCPYCNLTLRTYQQSLLPHLIERGAILVAISPQKPDGSLSMQEKNELAFPVLSDPGNSIARTLGALTQPTAEALAAQREHGLDLTETNADGTLELPMPTVVIVDTDGKVRWLDIHPDYTTRSEPDAIVSALDEPTSN
jgi:peroxiredoxin